MPSERTVAVIGGGFSGLWAARTLAHRGWQVHVFERENTLGGLAASAELAGHSIDRYYHFTCRADEGWIRGIAGTDLEKRFAWYPGRTANLVDGGLYPFSSVLDLLRFSPVPPLRRLLFGVFAGLCRWPQNWLRLDRMAAHTWLIRHIGTSLHRLLFEPLLRFKFGRDAHGISAAWMWHRLHRVSRSRDSLLGGELYGQLLGGMRELFSFLERDIRELGGVIHLGSEVQAIMVSGTHPKGVRTRTGEFPCGRIFAGIPLPELEAVLPDEFRSGLFRCSYLGIHCLVLALAHPIFPSFWVNLCHPELDINGLVCPTNLNPADSPFSLIYVPFYLRHDDPRWSATAHELAAGVIPTLQESFPAFRHTRLLDQASFRSRYAQPLFHTGFGSPPSNSLAGLEGFSWVEACHLFPEDRTLSGLLVAVERILSSPAWAG